MLDFGLGNDLAQIDVSVFFEGMQIQSGIYYKNRGDFVLICKNVVVTEDLIKKLKHFAFLRQSIYVEKKYYKDVLRANLHTRLQKGGVLAEALAKQMEGYDLEQALEIETSFQVALSETEDMLEEVADFGTLPPEKSQQLIANMENQIASFDGATLLQSVNSIRNSDRYLYNHCVDVSILNGLIAKWLKLSSKEISDAVKVGFLHDIGKLQVPAQILNKPGPLTPEEYEIVKRHAVASEEIMRRSGETDEAILHGVRGHHEHMNGMGYPDKLSGDAIPLFARITAISDVYSAMVSRRVYKPENSPFAILTEFARERYSHLDYSIVDVFLRNMPLEFVGKSVLLSDGEIAEVAYVNQNKLSYPIVKTKEGLIPTGPDLYCVSMSNPVSLFVEQSV